VTRYWAAGGIFWISKYAWAKGRNRFGQPLESLADNVARGIERLRKQLDSVHSFSEGAFDVAIQPALAIAVRLRLQSTLNHRCVLGGKACERREGCVSVDAQPTHAATSSPATILHRTIATLLVPRSTDRQSGYTRPSRLSP